MNEKEYKPKQIRCVYEDNFTMPKGEQFDVVWADDNGDVELINGQIFHCGTDGMRVRMMWAENDEERGTFVYGNRGGRLFL